MTLFYHTKRSTVIFGASWLRNKLEGGKCQGRASQRLKAHAKGLNSDVDGSAVAAVGAKKVAVVFFFPSSFGPTTRSEDKLFGSATFSVSD